MATSIITSENIIVKTETIEFLCPTTGGHWQVLNPAIPNGYSLIGALTTVLSPTTTIYTQFIYAPGSSQYRLAVRNFHTGENNINIKISYIFLKNGI